MSKPVIFLGPTMPHQDAASILDATYLPPAAQGDVIGAYNAYHPKTIAVVDGYFECVPSVWHKEILFIMARGVHVIGSSSMGALRAAELYQFGMVGVGRVFEDFKNGVIEDDDEVAVVHGPETVGYPLLSEALVNIRSTLEDAREQGVLNEEDMALLTGIAKTLHYKDRTYANIIRQAVRSGLSPALSGLLVDWLETGRRDAKREDAIKLLHLVKDMEKKFLPPKQVGYRFNNTMLWVKLLRSHSLLEKIPFE